MLGVRNYTRQYVEECRAKVELDSASFRQLAAEVASNCPGNGSVASLIDALEPRFYNNMVVVLDSMFIHRLRVVEGKDGNALNEVRVLAQSLLENGGVMGSDKTIKLVPEKSVLQYAPGSAICVRAADFERLANAFLAEIEAKYV